MDWVWTNFGLIWGLTLSQVWLSALPVVIGFVLSIPLGYLASRSRVARSILLSVGGILYTIPSLALFIVIPVIIGTSLLDPTNVIIALTVYAVAIMVRSSADAFASVPGSVQDSATAVGFSRAQRFFAVDFPLSGPVLLAGIRVVSVSTVSLVSVGSVIGVSSLGFLFTDGFQRKFYTEIWAGIVGTLVVAAVFDIVLVLIGRALMPWNRRATPNLARIVGSKRSLVPHK
ncbi:ABC transporter permease [Lacisediminihabitans changchengi]|uniref:ABC transporter permease subunit n=1 Tax=Lacisediminihabitans changchengi TaxID=2787634 RepID=A0A934SJQ8_9MICO|nr:ABC transporter permease subunit [Lacisediminihabitans changchengi]MBK4346570.1 ABC transporter permease subunit [Lacisediminihabitans changchengi]